LKEELTRIKSELLRIREAKEFLSRVSNEAKIYLSVGKVMIEVSRAEAMEYLSREEEVLNLTESTVSKELRILENRIKELKKK